MKKWKIITILILLWQLEYLPIPVFCKSINLMVQNVIIVLPLIVLIIAIILSIKWKRYWSLLIVPLLVFVFLLDWVLGDVKRTLCNNVIVLCNHNLKPKNAFNPILGVVMEKQDSIVIYHWSFFIAAESSAELVYEINHNRETTDDRECDVVINKDWYYHKFDVEF